MQPDRTESLQIKRKGLDQHRTASVFVEEQAAVGKPIFIDDTPGLTPL